jgi:hypothetical protein
MAHLVVFNSTSIITAYSLYHGELSRFTALNIISSPADLPTYKRTKEKRYTQAMAVVAELSIH